MMHSTRLSSQSMPARNQWMMKIALFFMLAQKVQSKLCATANFLIYHYVLGDSTYELRVHDASDIYQLNTTILDAYPYATFQNLTSALVNAVTQIPRLCGAVRLTNLPSKAFTLIGENVTVGYTTVFNGPRNQTEYCNVTSLSLAVNDEPMPAFETCANNLLYTKAQTLLAHWRKKRINPMTNLAYSGNIIPHKGLKKKINQFLNKLEYAAKADELKNLKKSPSLASR